MTNHARADVAGIDATADGAGPDGADPVDAGTAAGAGGAGVDEVDAGTAAGAGGGHSTSGLRAHARGHASARARVRAPRPLALALDELTAELEPTSLLGRVQTIWERATGPTIAANSSPVAEREGVLTVLCESSVWAHELEMLSSELIESLNSSVGSDAIVKLRCRTG